MDSVAVPSEHHDWVERLRHAGRTPLVPQHCLHAASNCWASPPCHTFSVRGPDYMHTKAKVPAGDCLLQPLAFHVFQGPHQISHIMNHPHSTVRVALDAAVMRASTDPQQHQPFVWTFNLQLGTKAHHCLVLYFVSFSKPPQGSLLQKFLDSDDAFRNAHLKLLTRFPEAPWLVQMMLGQRWPVCMLGKHMKCTYMKGKHYMEVDVDVGSSKLTRSAVNLSFGFTRLVVTDMAFVLEGTRSDELPERILGAMRIVKLEPAFATQIDMREVIHDDMLYLERAVQEGGKTKLETLRSFYEGSLRKHQVGNDDKREKEDER